MRRIEHYREAESLLASLKDFVGSHSPHTEYEGRAQVIAAAQVHATLATVQGMAVVRVVDSLGQLS